MWLLCSCHCTTAVTAVSCLAGKIGWKIRLVTLRTILDTRSNFRMFMQKFEHANRNATFFDHCNSEDGKCELHVHSFTIFASMWLQLRQLTPWLHSAEYVLVPRIVHNVTRQIFPPIFRLGTRLQLQQCSPSVLKAFPGHSTFDCLFTRKNLYPVRSVTIVLNFNSEL